MASERMVTDRKDWPHLLSVGAQVAALLGVLMLGALLETDASPAGEAVATLPPLPPPSAYRSAERPDTAIAPKAEPTAEAEPFAPQPTLAERADRDASRLEQSGPGFTLQLAMLCDAARVEEHLASYGDRHELYLLPVDHDGRLCFRLCWGHEATVDLARTASALPPALRSPQAFPTSVAAVLE